MAEDKNWGCRCGAKLPKTGTIWRSRYKEWVAKGSPKDSLYYCDNCADSRFGILERLLVYKTFI